MEVIITLVAIAVAVLQIILFFKIWVMTNDIREIKIAYLSSVNSNVHADESSTQTNQEQTIDVAPIDFNDEEAIVKGDKIKTAKAGSIVRRKSDKTIMKIERDLGNSLFLCVNPETGIAIASYKRFDFEVIKE